MNPSLHGLRIVVTSPPERWFYGLAHQYAARYADVLRAGGAEVLAIPVAAFKPGPSGQIRAVVESIRRFRPDLAIGLHDAGYALLCQGAREGDSAPSNVFVDWLDLPTVMIWDHGMLQFAPLLLGKLPDAPTESAPDCLGRIRRALEHPLYVHVARDTGQRDLVDQLGVLGRDRVAIEVSFAHPEFSEASPDVPVGAEVAFFGHMPHVAPDLGPARHHPALGLAFEATLDEKLAHLEVPAIGRYMQRLAELPALLKTAMRLDEDQSYYWSLVTSGAGLLQARLRAAVLERLNRPVAFYGDAGGLTMGATVQLRPERFAFGADLAAAYAGTKIVVDVVNPGFIHGFGTKAINCFAAGGFLLQDRKDDFVRTFGEPGELASYSTLDELRAKIDRFLTQDDARREVSAAIRAQIVEQHTLPVVFARLIERALALRR